MLRTRAFWLFVLATVVAAAVLSHFASPRPDALEHSLANYREDGGDAAVAASSESTHAGAPTNAAGGEAAPEQPKTFAGNAIEGIAGSAIVFAVIAGAAMLLKRRGRRSGKAAEIG
jgi:hypothetical protein